MKKSFLLFSIPLAIACITSTTFGMKRTGADLTPQTNTTSAMKRRRLPITLHTDEQLDCHLEKLPEDIIKEILLKTDIFEWNSLSIVNKKFHNVMNSMDMHTLKKFMGQLTRKDAVSTKAILSSLKLRASKHYTNTIMPFNKFIITAIKSGDYLSFEASLTKVDLEYMGRRCNTFLNYAAKPTKQTFSITSMNDVLEKNSNTAAADKTQAQLAIIKTLVQLNPEDCNVPNIFGNIPIMYDASVEVTKILARYSDLSIKNNVGNTPLYNAARNFKPDTVALLIEYKADPFQEITTYSALTKKTSVTTPAHFMRIFYTKKIIEKWEKEKQIIANLLHFAKNAFNI